MAGATVFDASFGAGPGAEVCGGSLIRPYIVLTARPLRLRHRTRLLRESPGTGPACPATRHPATAHLPGSQRHRPDRRPDHPHRLGRRRAGRLCRLRRRRLQPNTNAGDIASSRSIQTSPRDDDWLVGERGSGSATHPTGQRLGGLTSEGGMQSDTLREVGVPILSDRFLARSAGPRCILHALADGLRGSPGRQEPCPGDGGGPMRPAFGGVFRQSGVVSFGDGCAEPDEPGVLRAGTERRPVADRPRWGGKPSAHQPRPERDRLRRQAPPSARAGEGATIAGFGSRDVLTGTDGPEMTSASGAGDKIRKAARI